MADVSCGESWQVELVSCESGGKWCKWGNLSHSGELRNTCVRSFSLGIAGQTENRVGLRTGMICKSK